MSFPSAKSTSAMMRELLARDGWNLRVFVLVNREWRLVLLDADGVVQARADGVLLDQALRSCQATLRKSGLLLGQTKKPAKPRAARKRVADSYHPSFGPEDTDNFGDE